MIEIFINPERGIIGGETFEAMNMTLASIEIINAQEASIRAAEKLLSVNILSNLSELTN